MLSGKFLDNVLRIFPNSCVRTRVQNPSLVTLGETFKTQFISILGGGTIPRLQRQSQEEANGPFANLVEVDPACVHFQRPTLLNLCVLPLLKLRANHSSKS